MGFSAILIGAPGSGKGTQASLLSAHKAVPHVSTGDILRREIQSASAVGTRVADIVNAGCLVPDDLILEIVVNRLSNEDCRNGFILDGLPRTIIQAELLEKEFVAMGIVLDFVIHFVLDDDELLQRLVSRRSTEARADDASDIQIRRLQLYHKETEPLIDFYGKKNCLVDLDASGSVDSIFKRLVEIVDRAS